MMFGLIMFLLGFFSCLLFLYMLGTRRHQGHGDKKMSGPSSKSQLHENVVVQLKKG
jgi:hypothetical protein